MLRNIIFALALLSTPAFAQIKTQPAAAPTRANAAPNVGGVSNVLLQGGASSVSDNCSVPNSYGYGNTSFGFALNLQHADSNCVRIRKARIWLDIAVVSGNKFYASVAAELMLQDAETLKAYQAATKRAAQK